jgi:hypothetical protein
MPYAVEYRDTAIMLADSQECDTSADRGDCARAIICRRCGHCFAHCCCHFWHLMTEWSEAFGLEVDDMIHDERLSMTWADDGGHTR